MAPTTEYHWLLYFVSQISNYTLETRPPQKTQPASNNIYKKYQSSLTNKPKEAYNKQTWQPVSVIARFGCQRGNGGQSRETWQVQKGTLYSLDTSIKLHSAHIEK